MVDPLFADQVQNRHLVFCLRAVKIRFITLLFGEAEHIGIAAADLLVAVGMRYGIEKAGQGHRRHQSGGIALLHNRLKVSLRQLGQKRRSFASVAKQFQMRRAFAFAHDEDDILNTALSGFAWRRLFEHRDFA